MGRKKLDDNERKNHQTFRATNNTLEWLEAFGGTKQKGFDLLIEWAQENFDLYESEDLKEIKKTTL